MDSEEEMADNEWVTVVFVHIPKTGGTSLMRSLRDEYGEGLHRIKDNRADPRGLEEFRRMPKDHLTAVASHVSYGIHEDIPGPVRYVTMLRHPEERIGSNCRYVLDRPDHPLHEAVRSGQRITAHDNAQTRILAGGMNIGTQPFDRPVNEADLERAISNLDHFTFVGLMEEYDRSLLGMATTLGWTHRPVSYMENRSESEYDVEVDPSLTVYDWQLYEEGTRRFDLDVSRLTLLIHRARSRITRYRSG